MSRRRQIRTFDLFCGAGGSSWGAALAGARIVGGVDVDPTAMSTYASNFSEAHWTNPGKAEELDLTSVSKKVGRVDLLLASPECTNHTHARGAAPTDEASREKAFQVLRFAKAFSPRWVVIENVVNMEGWNAYGRLLAELAAEGYHWRAMKLNAADFGVPQARRRLFIVFDREQLPPVVAPPPDVPRTSAKDVVDLEGEYRWSLLDEQGRAGATIARAARARAVLGDGTPFLIVYYGTDKAGGWQSLEVPLRTVTTLDRFAIVKWVGREPHMRMLQPVELQKAMGLNGRVGNRYFTLPHGTRRDKVRLLGNAVCAPVMRSVVEALCLGNP